MPNFLSPGSPARRALGASLVPVLVATMGCGGGALVPASSPSVATQPRPARPTPDAVWIDFRPDIQGQHWSVIGGDEKLLCELPCARWVSDPASVSVQYEEPGTITMLRMGLPADLGPPGGSVIATPRVKGGSRTTGNALAVGGASLAIAGALLFGFIIDIHSNERVIAATSLGLGVGGTGLLLAGIGLYMRFTSHSPDVLVRAGSASSRPTFALGPGFAEAGASSPGGPRIILTPLGAAGTF